MKLGGLLWWIGAFIFAGLAGILTFALLSSSTPAISQVAGGGNTEPVVVAAVNIPFRRSITESDLVIKDFPADAVPDGSVQSVDQVVGKMSSVDIVANEPIILQQLVTPDIVTQQVALSIPNGRIVTAVPMDSKLIENRLVRPGDKIDLLATFEIEVVREQSSSPMPESVSMLQNLEVHAIILPVQPAEDATMSLSADRTSEGGVFRTADEKGQSVLLAVEPQDALTIRHVLDVGGDIDLALRAPNDESVGDTVAVDQFYLAERFQIDLVRNLNITTGVSE